MIAVLDYGIGNLRSAEKALQHVGSDARLVSDPAEAARADGVVLPGVGAFGPCARALRERGLDTVALDAVVRGIPFLGICIGFQLLYEGSEEDPNTPGLGVLPGVVRALPPGVKHPQMQWNVLDIVRPAAPVDGVDPNADGDPGLLAGIPDPAWVYFVHSFAPEVTGETTSTCDYGGTVTASAELGPVWGTQFHPEKSGPVGLGILANFVRRVDGTGTVTDSVAAAPSAPATGTGPGTGSGSGSGS
ncbi:MAG TPA: imidazole glycerol phosphate synthase subunit HisH [Acidimicrobiales bacterium]|nr:imidazole glycerol phosphate synthase subunit HisH [Acidimicrobiales bacterium]